MSERQDGWYCKAPDKEEVVDHSAGELGLKWEEGPLSGVMEKKKGEPMLNKSWHLEHSPTYQGPELCP